MIAVLIKLYILWSASTELDIKWNKNKIFILSFTDAT